MFNFLRVSAQLIIEKLHVESFSQKQGRLRDEQQFLIESCFADTDCDNFTPMWY